MMPVTSQESAITIGFRAATHTLRILDAYQLHRPLEDRTPNDLVQEAEIAGRLRAATVTPLPEQDPMHHVFQSLADPCMEGVREQLIIHSASEFIRERRLERTLAELSKGGEENQVLQLKVA